MGRMMLTVTLALALGAALIAQTNERPASPGGSAAMQVGGKYEPGPDGPAYKGGKWIEVTFDRPIKRGRDLFGSGATYGKLVNSDAPVWRAGANVSTQLKTEVPLVIAGKTIAPGTYTMFVDLKPNNWTLIVSNWKAQSNYDPNNKTALWGSFGYTPDKDVVRAPMKTEQLPHSHEQLSWEFLDASESGATLALMWDKTMGSVEFRVGR
jgi:Protein of unknown function (DUF2911)